VEMKTSLSRPSCLRLSCYAFNKRDYSDNVNLDH
jgi:hypothetical protein